MTRNWLLYSNGAPKSEHADVKTGRHPTKFKRTPRMSTYLGDFEHIEQVVGNGRQRIRAYTLPGKNEQARFSLSTAVRAISLMEEYFEVAFVMDKIDMVGLPTLEAGPMEN